MLRPITEDGSRAGVDVTEIRLGESVIPPELLVARQREQLAQQLKRAYEQEQIAQAQRQASEQARATADQQKDIVGAQINLKKAQLNEETRAADGRAERAYLEQQAAGQTAQVSVLGQASVLDLQKTKMLFDLLGQHPELIANLKLPSTVVFGSGGLEGPAAIIGSALGTRPAVEGSK
jgi:regulator of protease activity HflC (stomatin/prohibitin superfamily)